MAVEEIGGTDAADQDELGGERADPGELLEFVDGVVGVHGAEPVPSEAPSEGCFRRCAQLLDLGRGELQHHGRGLRHADPGADDRPGGRLVRGEEQHGPKVAVSALQPRDDRVVLADRGEALRAGLALAADRLADPRISRIVPDLLAHAGHDERFARELFERVGLARRQHGKQLLRRATDRAELPAGIDLELAADLIAAPMYWRMTVTRQRFTGEDLDLLVQATVAALGALRANEP